MSFTHPPQFRLRATSPPQLLITQLRTTTYTAALIQIATGALQSTLLHIGQFIKAFTAGCIKAADNLQSLRHLMCLWANVYVLLVGNGTISSLQYAMRFSVESCRRHTSHHH
jgi:hypothetical protein